MSWIYNLLKAKMGQQCAWMCNLTTSPIISLHYLSSMVLSQHNRHIRQSDSLAYPPPFTRRIGYVSENNLLSKSRMPLLENNRTIVFHTTVFTFYSHIQYFRSTATAVTPARLGNMHSYRLSEIGNTGCTCWKYQKIRHQHVLFEFLWQDKHEAQAHSQPFLCICC